MTLRNRPLQRTFLLAACAGLLLAAASLPLSAEEGGMGATIDELGRVIASEVEGGGATALADDELEMLSEDPLSSSLKDPLEQEGWGLIENPLYVTEDSLEPNKDGWDLIEEWMGPETRGQVVPRPGNSMLRRQTERRQAAPQNATSGKQTGKGSDTGSSTSGSKDAKAPSTNSLTAPGTKATSKIRSVLNQWRKNPQAGDFPGGADKRIPGAKRGPAPPALGPAAKAGAVPPAKTPPETGRLALAAHAGYGHVFKNAGIQVGYGPQGKPQFTKKDGSAASQTDLDQVKAAISREPRALQKRPDFFQVLPRPRFEDLRTAYQDSPGRFANTFQDVGMTEDRRDFAWTRTCLKVSGECNPHAEKGGYEKGEDVEPESLDKMWEDIFTPDPEADAESRRTLEREFAEKVAARAHEKLGRRRVGFGAISDKIAGIGASLKGIFGSSPQAGSDGAVVMARTIAWGPPAAAQAAAGAKRTPMGADPRQSPSRRIGPTEKNASRRPHQIAPGRQPASQAARFGFWIVAGAGLLMFGLGLSRRRRGPHTIGRSYFRF